MIRLEDVCKVFAGAQGPVEAVKHVHLTIKSGEIFGIIGFFRRGKVHLASLHQSSGTSHVGQSAVRRY